jgi:hypothetical protein
MQSNTVFCCPTAHPPNRRRAGRPATATTNAAALQPLPHAHHASSEGMCPLVGFRQWRARVANSQHAKLAPAKLPPTWLPGGGCATLSGLKTRAVCVSQPPNTLSRVGDKMRMEEEAQRQQHLQPGPMPAGQQGGRQNHTSCSDSSTTIHVQQRRRQLVQASGGSWLRLRTAAAPAEHS